MEMIIVEAPDTISTETNLRNYVVIRADISYPQAV